MKVLICGDFYISDEFKDKDLISDSIINLFESVDYRIINLEAPITKNNSKIVKTGPFLRMGAEIITPFLKKLNVNAVTLANNHILDYDNIGLNDTLNYLKEHEISYFGAGKNIAEAAKPHILKKKGLKTCFLNFCENEWSIATEKKAGANPIDLINNYQQIKLLKKKYDKIICIVHGGQLHYTLPSPSTQKFYRFLVDCGADAVISHHTHSIGGNENYKNAPIYYGLGSFMFTVMKNEKNKPFWYNGVITVLNINENITAKQYLTVQNKKNFKVSLVDEKNKIKIENVIKNLNKKIASKSELDKEWYRYIKEYKNYPLNHLSPINEIKSPFLKYVLKKIGIYNFWPSKRFKKELLNILSCESHREKLIKILKEDIKK